MKKTIILAITFWFWCSVALFAQQPEVYDCIFYIDPRGQAANCFTTEEKTLIQAELNDIKAAGKKLNIVFWSEECDPYYVATPSNGGGSSYIAGPGPANKFWAKTDDELNYGFYLCQPSSMAATQMPNAPGRLYHNLYYCEIMQAIEEIKTRFNLGNLRPLSWTPCLLGEWPEVYSATDKVYLNGDNYIAEDFLNGNSYWGFYTGVRGRIKSEFCTDIVFHTPYHLERFTDFSSHIDDIQNQIGEDFILITLNPLNEDGEYQNYKSNITVDVHKSAISPSIIKREVNGVIQYIDQNCRPVSRDLSPADLLDIEVELNKTPYASTPNFTSVGDALDWLRFYMFDAAAPVPGEVSCATGNSTAAGYSPPSNYKHLTANHNHRFKVFTPKATPTVYESGKYKDFAGLSPQEAEQYKEATKYASSHGFDLKIITSGYKGDPAAYNAAKAAFNTAATQLSPNGGLLFLHWDDQSRRMYYQIEFGNGVKSGISPFKGKMESAISHFIGLNDLAEEHDKNPDIRSDFKYPPSMIPKDENPWYFGVRSDKTDKAWASSLAELMATGKDVVLEGELPSRIWHPDSTTCIFDSPGMVTGSANGLLANVEIPAWDITQLAGFGYDVFTDQELRNSLRQVKAHQVVTLLFQDKLDAIEALNSPTTKTEVKQYFGAVLLVGLVGAMLTGNIPVSDADDFAKKLKELFDDHGIEGYDEFIEQTKTRISHDTNLDGNKKVKDQVADHLGELRKKFIKDLEAIGKNNPDDLKRFVDNPNLIDQWAILGGNGHADLGPIRTNVDNLEKADNFLKEFQVDKSLFTQEYNNVPLPEKKAWIDFLEFRSKDGKVKKAGNSTSQYGSFPDNASVPARYNSDPRFENLATDPAHVSPNVPGSGIDTKTRQEAMAGLSAEGQGIITGPIQRSVNPEAEFIDANGSEWDVKGPRGEYFNLNSIGKSLMKELEKYPDRKIILDCTWIDQSQLVTLRSWMNENLNQLQKSRIFEVNSNLFQ